MKISIISGSHRQNSQSIKVSKHIEKTLLKSTLSDETYLLSLAGNPIPLWDESIWEGDEEWKRILNPISDELESSDGFVIVTPEYHGQVPAALKNFFLMWKKQLAHKPALIVAVSSVDGGSYPVAELRMSSYKNNRICYLPEHLIIRNVESVLNDDEEKNNSESDAYFRERIQWSLGILNEYSKALKTVRDSGVTDTDKFTNGM
ncbi:NAD(P)H-dependent oxidoreductase [Cocleimonas sp. KMM 6892]|uniref:NADPH-dependent FMN reductase n=1 Tax=unclassified Cocleimonas TaxID=2639732 RepID=UPI002DBEBBC8|nr:MULTISPECIES: NAD(P)H-dependent oxidoreductase [unclassified Cocleimonas]MEB8432555.1 NAD(P)H-dependent oxidoreductase [Cocleimonas sp. KMM 6892]MEC4715414.1 NAD(P)H-dependent oxidoreductase [Cocleimonas sp. KMM 6895]MEC4744967.1 NAD(P)H-dependent oxidoreductase [Cocleimonas sp. KMM 6896]